MKSVRVQYCGPLGLAAGEGWEVVPVGEANSIGGFVRALAERTGGEFARMVLDSNGELRSTLLVAVDGEQVEDFSQALGEGVGEITLLPPIAGG